MVLLEPTDGGPIYAETDLSAFIAEPWNALSSLAISLPALYWAFKLRWKIKEYSFLYFLMPLLFLGGIGSTLYHASRVNEWLLWMDVLPTAVVTLSVAVYFWDKILSSKWYVASLVLPFTFFRFLLQDLMPGHFATNINYILTGFLIFFPIILYLKKQGFRFLKPVAISVVFLVLSLLMRRIDFTVAEIIPMGSHFLWHILSGFGAFYLAKYLFLIRRDELNHNSA